MRGISSPSLSEPWHWIDRFISGHVAHCMMGTPNNLLDCVGGNHHIRLQTELDSWNWSEEELTRALRDAVRLRSYDCVDVLINHKQTVLRLHFAAGSKLSVLLRLLATENVEGLRTQLDHCHWSEDELKQVLLRSWTQMSLDCLTMLVYHRSIPVHHRQEDGRTLLHLLVENTELLTRHGEDTVVNLITGVCEKVQMLDKRTKEDLSNDLDKPAYSFLDFREKDKGWTAMHFAVKMGRIEVVQCLVQFGASVNSWVVKTRQSSTVDAPLTLAVQYKHAKIAEYLLRCGSCKCIDVCVDGWRSYSIGQLIQSHNFTINEKEQLIDALAESAQRINPIDFEDIAFMFQFGRPESIVKLLQKNIDNCVLNPTSDSRANFCFGRALAGKRENLEILLNHPVMLECNLNRILLSMQDFCIFTDLDEHYVDSVLGYDEYMIFTPVQFALRAGKPEILRLLLDRGIDTNAVGETSIPPICHIMEYKFPGGIECYRQLLRYGCNLDVTIEIDNVVERWDLPIGLYRMSLLDFYLNCVNIFVLRMFAAIGLRKHSFHNVNRNALKSEYTSHEHILHAVVSPEDLQRFSVENLCTVPSLSQLARLKIRSGMARNIEKKIETLPLPTHIKCYLNLAELDYLENEYELFKKEYNL